MKKINDKMYKQKIKKEYKYPSEMPIYKITYDLLGRCARIKKTMNKLYRYDFGERLVNYSFDCLECLDDIYYDHNERIKMIKKYIATIDKIENVIKICIDSKTIGDVAINENDYIVIMPILANAKRQSIGWLYSMLPKDKQNPEFNIECSIEERYPLEVALYSHPHAES